MSTTTFQTPSEEVLYWKTMALSWEKELADTRLTLDDFQTSSRELEEELERELHILEEQNKKLSTQNQSLVHELDELTQKHQASCLSSGQSIYSLQKELENLREEYDLSQRKAVNLEMDNEELESFKRAAHSSILDMEKKYNEAREWKERYEQESRKRGQMREEIQRLKDELQDLENELRVVRSHSPISPALSPTPFNFPPTPTPCKRSAQDSEAPGTHSPSLSPTPPSPVPTARRLSEYRRKGGSSVSTLQEIMERVKTLENRLISCRTRVKPFLPNSHTNPTKARTPALPPAEAGEMLTQPGVW
ncbi:hypothetical protein K493DRAFT_318394 [Basidiobolus meristosporus CBS 931.73]|uniref:Uncharacterized protein n=1 Tax=Basidiobolus meristosporus CBS 931.73 TaxID=1314790 RepID=A0A1Y1XVQ5_9FUNG|nr:hypothetical protein K493DRAFT_318394 [Basidiobolus meristosporus CBS 931.73]|eukprot:ORX89837.1 hypothetical protein K493DRAFT_318394 [Basidiobolus meristosporus CBS 931.73]